MDWSQFVATALPSLISLLVTTLIGFLAFRGGMGQKQTEAQQGAITALNTELNLLRNKVADQEREKEKMRFELDAIQAALEDMGMIVTMRGKTVIIKDSKMGSTTIHIEDKKE
jgi:cell division protein FtsB